MKLTFSPTEISKIAISSLVSILLNSGCGVDKSSSVKTPMPPTNLSAQALSHSAIQLQWHDNSDDESDFMMFRRDSSDWNMVGSVSSNIITYLDTLLQDSTGYLYYVVAANSFGSSTPSETAAVWTASIGSAPLIPSQPTPADDTLDADIECALTWQCTDPDGDPLTFNIYFGTGPYLGLVDSNLADLSYAPGRLNFNTAYQWQVIARDNHRHRTESPVWTFSTTDSLHAIYLAVSGQGRVIINPDRRNYSYGDSVTLSALAEPDWRFDGWSGDTVASVNPLTIVVKRDLSLHANFIPGNSIAVVSGTVSWPGHVLSSHTYAFADSIANNNLVLIGQTSVNPANGAFTMTINNIASALYLKFEAQDDVNNSGPWSYIDPGDGWGFFDYNQDGRWNDLITVAPGDLISGVNISLQQVLSGMDKVR